MMCPSTKRLFKLALIIGLCAFSLISLLDYLFTPSDEEDDHHHHHQHNDVDADVNTVDHHKRNKNPVYLPPEPPTDLPIIVWWSDFIPEKRSVRKCSLGSCLVTKSRTELTNPNTNVSVFMWYGSDVSWIDLPLPRKPHHLWALLHEESPKNNWVFATDKGIELFNFTATCSRHSSYPLVSQYLYSIDKLTQPLRVPTPLKSKSDMALVIYIQTDCNPPSDRDSYVTELMKHIKVDSYGNCLHNKDLPDHLLNPLTFDSEDLLNIIAKYKFAISFENAICHDYITEKFWRPLYAGTVPIVRGSPTILDWAPSEKSIIVAEDFPTPKELADFLILLDKNDREYNEYLEWKRNGITNQRLLSHMRDREWHIDDLDGLNFIDGFQCYICDELHKMKKEKSHERLVANKQHYDCPMAEPALRYRDSDTVHERLAKMDEEAKSELEFWRYIAKCSEQKGIVISRIVSEGGTQEQAKKALEDACYGVLLGEV